MREFNIITYPAAYRILQIIQWGAGCIYIIANWQHSTIMIELATIGRSLQYSADIADTAGHPWKS